MPKPPVSTVSIIDTYAQSYQTLFPDVRSFNHFKQLLLGLTADLPRKTLPAIAKAVGADAQSLHHFLCVSPWQTNELRNKRLAIIKEIVGELPITICIDETGDKKKGKTTDYVSRQYLSNVGKIDNGIVSVHAYGYINGLAFPLLFRVFKPKERLKPTDKYRTKPELAAEMMQEILHAGFRVELVLADTIYGESNDFVAAMNNLELNFILATRRNHVPWWLPSSFEPTYKEWQQFDRVFSNGTKEQRYIREIVFRECKALKYYQITTDIEQLPEDSTWRVRTDLRNHSPAQIGNSYGLRTWIEYGFRQMKSELGWKDYRLTEYEHIERWWELILCAYVLVCQGFQRIQESKTCTDLPVEETKEEPKYSNNSQSKQAKDKHDSWKSVLNDLRMRCTPYICLCLLMPWLNFFEYLVLQSCLVKLVEAVNSLPTAHPI